MNGKITHVKKRRLLFKFITAMLIFVLYSGTLLAQERTITGNIADKDGVPLPGVSVVIKGTVNGAVTDIDGNFTLKVPDNSAVLHITYVGYAEQDITVGDMTAIKVTLEEDVREIDQVVVIGYGTQKKSDLTGSIASVSAKDLNSIPVARVDEALVGRAAGVNVVATSGMPGSSNTIIIRGTTSINGSAPLIVIDGIPGGDMNKISPSEIESIEVLKDAASNAIYGSAGGAGVILITTKKGKEGKVTTSLNVFTGIQDVPKKVDVMNTRQWNQFYTAKNGHPFIYSEDSLNMNHNWQDAIYDRALLKNVELSIRGGSEKSSFSISSNYLTQEGIVKNTGYDKFLVSLSSSHALTKKIKIDQVVRYAYDKTKGPAQWQYQNIYNNFTTLPALTALPFLEPYDENNKWTVSPIGGMNPFVGIDARSNQYVKNHEVQGNVGLVIDIIKGLSFTSRIGGTVNNQEYWNFQPEYYSWANDNNPISKLTQTWTKYYSWTFQNYVNYNTTLFSKHNISLMVGMEAYDKWDYNITGFRQEFSSSNPDLLYFDNSLDNSTDAQKIGGSGKEMRNQAYFGRINYDYKGIFLLQANVRNEGNSNFGPNNRRGTFKSYSAGFKFSELEAIKNLNLFSFGKFRVGYGESGQFSHKTYWPYASSILNAPVMNYAFDDANVQTGLGPVQVPNPDLKWETVKVTNAAFDLGFMKDQLYVTIEYYNKVNDGMIMPKAVPSVAGTYLLVSGSQPAELGTTGIRSPYPTVNYGAVSNKGLETTINYKKQIGELRINLGTNFTFQKNEITKLATDSTIQGGVHDLAGITISKVGQPIGTFRGFEFDGIFKDGDRMVYNTKSKRYVFADQPFYIDEAGDTNYAKPFAKPGDARWVDINGDGKLDSKDWTYLGSYNPTFVYGFNFSLEYKGIDFSMFWQGVKGNKIFNGVKRTLYDWQTSTNHAAEFADRYHLPVEYNGQIIDPGNTSSNMPDIGSANWGVPSSLYIEDGSYFRLRTVTLGYTLPTNITSKIGLDKVRIYFIGKNLITFTKYSGFDPEISNTDDPTVSGIDIAGYPQSKMYTFGINLEF